MSKIPGAVAAVVLVALLAACQSQPAPASAPTADRNAAAPLEALAACTDPGPGTGESVEGLIVPEDTIVQKVTPSDPLVNVAGYAPMTPVQFEQFYRDREGIEVLLGENEVFEAEMLISDGTYRNFLKATAVCDRGVQIIAVVAPELDAEGLPVPQGGVATPTPQQ